MTDIVKRLERLATWGGKATHLDYEGAILDAKAEIETLRADNERLRAALQNIESETHGLGMSRQIARAALEGKE